jgi:hypothetical protein
MSIDHLLATPVEIYRDGKKILETKAQVQEGTIYFKDVDVRQLDIIKVIPTKEEFEVISHPYRQLHPITNTIVYIEAKVRKS